MRLIPTFVHGVLDYLMGIVLIAAPWLLGFSDNVPATRVPVALGVGVILYSLLTHYELGLLRVIPMNVHLMLDLLGGILLAASPWLFGFSQRVMVPHVVFGLLEIGASLMTRLTPRASAPAPASSTEPAAGGMYQAR